MSKLFSELMASITHDAGVSSIDVPDDWGMGRTTFGGLQAALALDAMRRLVTKDVPLRTLQITFIAPVPVGRIQARALVLRAGKNATQTEARIVDGDQTLAVTIGVFGLSRQSAVTIEPQQPPVEPAKPVDFRFIPGITPSFTQHFAVKWLRGLPPFTGDTETRHVVELGMKDSGRVTEAHVLAIADFIPPVALSMLRKPARAGDFGLPPGIL